jgi:hypothetical protein
MAWRRLCRAATVAGVRKWLDASGLLVPPAALVRFMQENFAKWVGVARENDLKFEAQ